MNMRNYKAEAQLVLAQVALVLLSVFCIMSMLVIFS